MRFTKNGIIILAIIIFSFDCAALSANFNNTEEPLEVLFIGSSYFNYWGTPAIFQEMAESAGKNINVASMVPSGALLINHANSSFTLAKINERNWDYVILQGVGKYTAYPELGKDVKYALEKLKEQILANCESTKVVFCMPWAYEDGMTWAGWLDTYLDMQTKIYENTLSFSNDVGFMVAPVGWAWERVLREKNYPLHYLHEDDWNHPSLKGSYLMACVIFSAVFQESSTGLNYYGTVQEDEAKYFQNVASSIVMNNLELWNIVTMTGAESLMSTDLKKVDLHQNYPNPFKTNTIINYTLKKPGLVTLKVFDIFGREVDVLVNEFQMASSYSADFNPVSLSNGLYYYSLQLNNEFKVTKPLILSR